MSKLVRFDWAMKHLLRNKANFDILEGFLSELLMTQIKIDSILESESNKNNKEDKSNRVDLLVKTEQGERIIIEVQCQSQWDYFSRILYGTSKVVTEHMMQGKPYGNICKIIAVSIVFFNLGAGKDYLYKGATTFRGIHRNDVLQLTPRELKLYTKDSLNPRVQAPEDIFPEYYLIKVDQFNERVTNKIDEWIYFLKHGQTKSTFSAQGLKSAAEKFNILHLSEAEQREYQRYCENLSDEASYAVELKVAQEEAQAKGEAIGEARGEAKGKVEGEIIGITKVVLNMHKKGFSLDVIAETTGLTIVEVKAMILQHEKLPEV